MIPPHYDAAPATLRLHRHVYFAAGIIFREQTLEDRLHLFGASWFFVCHELWGGPNVTIVPYLQEKDPDLIQQLLGVVDILTGVHPHTTDMACIYFTAAVTLFHYCFNSFEALVILSWVHVVAIMRFAYYPIYVLDYS